MRLAKLDIIGGLSRTFNLILAVVEPLIEGDVLGGLSIVLVLLVVLGKTE